MGTFRIIQYFLYMFFVVAIYHNKLIARFIMFMWLCTPYFLPTLFCVFYQLLYVA